MDKTLFLIGRCGLNLEDFYPEDLPIEWRFDYYSTLFKTLSLPINTDEDLEQIFEECRDNEEEFELVLSLTPAQLANAKQLKKTLSPHHSERTQFTLFSLLTAPPSKAVMSALKAYQFCFQSPRPLGLGLKEIHLPNQILSFNHTPVLYANELEDELQIRHYLEQISITGTKTLLIFQFAQKDTLNKIRIISELLGF